MGYDIDPYFVSLVVVVVVVQVAQAKVGYLLFDRASALLIFVPTKPG